MGRVLVIAVVVVALWATGAAAWPGPPRGPVPTQPKGPPAAWVETSDRSIWLAFGSYCWTRPSQGGGSAVCADMIPPQSRNDLPVLRVRLGEWVRVHLGFTPSQAHLTSFHGLRFTHTPLAPNRILRWRVRGFGIVSVDVKARAGSAAYLVRLVRRTTPGYERVSAVSTSCARVAAVRSSPARNVETQTPSRSKMRTPAE